MSAPPCVDVDEASSNGLDHAVRRRKAGSPDRGCQSIRRGIGKTYRLLLGLETHDREHRTEYFLARQRHLRRDIRENCWRHVIAAGFGMQSIHAVQQTTAFPFRPRQDPNRSLNPRLRIGHALVEGARNFGIGTREASDKSRQLLELVGMDDSALTRFPHQFSGGQRQRICIARALASEPDILVADEAVSALDVSVQAQIIELLEDLRNRLGLAILFITHDLRVAGQLCDRLIVMQSGRIMEQGPTADLFNHPREPYTRDLLAAAQGREFLARAKTA